MPSASVMLRVIGGGADGIGGGAGRALSRRAAAAGAARSAGPLLIRRPLRHARAAADS